MTYKVYQINLTDDEVDTINKANDHFAIPKGKANMDAMVGKYDPANFKFYEHVADIDAAGLEDVFEIGNIGPEEKITRHAPMHSLSVGDIVEDPTGARSIVKMMGYEAI